VRNLRAFAFGTIAVGALAYSGAAALAVTAQTAGRSLALVAGPLVVVAVEHEGSVAAITFGPGLIAIAILGGLVNVAAALLIGRRAEGRGDGVG